METLTQQQKKLGYYTVGDQVYYSKIDACKAGTKYDKFPQWNFNDSVWQSQNWLAEPETNILELYKLRARQLREQYDYLVVYYSGGSDSQTLVEAFVDANCFIDEIVTVWNRSHDKNFVASPGVTDARNVEAEFDLTTKPGLEWIKKVSPKTKITYQDVSNHIIDQLTNFDGEEWLGQITEHLNPQNLGRYSAPKLKEQLLLLDKGKRTAVVFGADKPKLCIKDGRYCIYFVDVIANNFKGVAANTEYNNMHPEYFYWTPDMPEIIVKQAHIIKKWFEANPALKPVLAWPNYSWGQRNTYETIVKTLIYPNWDLCNFQVDKTRSSVFCEWDYWFFTQYKDTNVYHNWLKGIQHVTESIDRKFLSYSFDGTFNGFVGMINGHFYLE